MYYANKVSTGFGGNTDPQYRTLGSFPYNYLYFYTQFTSNICFQKTLFMSHLSIDIIWLNSQV